MDELMLFTDGSLSTQSNIGYGAYLLVPKGVTSPDLLKPRVKVKAVKLIQQLF